MFMKTKIKTTNIKLTDYLTSIIDEKIKDIEKVLSRHSKLIAEIEIGLTSKHHQKGDIYRAEIQIQVPGKLLRAVSEKEDFRSALTEVKDELQIQIKKYKDKMTLEKRRKIKE